MLFRSCRNGCGGDCARSHTSHGGGLDRSRVVAQRGAILPGTAVAATARAVAGWPGRWACKGAGWVCLETGQEGGTRGCKRVARPDDRLLGTPQTAQEGTDEIIRSQQVRDRGHAVEQSLAVYRALALSDVVDEYEAAMQHFPVR